MSILDYPRFHFHGQARVNAPTGNRNSHRQIDMASNTVRLDGADVDLSQPPHHFHQRMRTLPPRYDVDGRQNPEGPFSQAAGYNFAGNNHFSWENVRIDGVQWAQDNIDQHDSLVGAKLALWGHYNDYLRTSFNRARWVELDPSRFDSVQIYAGQFTLAPGNAGPNTPLLFSADIDRTHAARWVNSQHIVERSRHFLDHEFGLVRLFQFSVHKRDPYFLFGALGDKHTSLNALRRTLDDDRVRGLTIQYALFNMSAPQQPDTPVFYDLAGCIGLWREGEPATCPTGRLLLPEQPCLGPILLTMHPERVSLNMMTAIPFTSRTDRPESAHKPTPALGGKLPLGDLQLQTSSGAIVARIPEALYLDYDRHHGIIDVPVLRQAPDSDGLTLQSAQAQWNEAEDNVQSDCVNLYLEAPDRGRGIDFPVTIQLHGTHRGQPAAIEPPLVVDPTERLSIQLEPGLETGQATLTLTGRTPGLAQVRLGKHKWAQTIHVRVQPDDWHLDEVPAEQVDYAFLYRHVMSYYELIYPFMSDKVFSLADRCKCETYARLMWQMCDPQNRDKSYYMPSTRELSQPKSRLFLKYLEHVEASARGSPPADATEPAPISGKAELVRALKKAVDLELTVMLQYLYAGYSIPNYAQGQQRVAQGQWTEAQLALACGGLDRRRDGGIRGTLMEIAHEEMIHYLVVNNLLMALGEPFYPGQPVLGAQAQIYFGLDTEFALEPFSEHVLARFVRDEWPSFIPAPGGSIADFYTAIRRAFTHLTGVFDDVDGKRGGEHHLFLNELTNRAFPGFQLAVFDTESALFAIDFVTNQGEGCALDSPHFEHSHFQRLRALCARLAAEPVPFEPALPALKNPTLEPRVGCNTVHDADARALMRLYQGCHELMFLTMGQHFAQTPAGSLRRSRLMNAAIDMMTGLLRPISVTLMNLPAGIAGRHAGPPLPAPFQHRWMDEYSTGCQMLAKRCQVLADQARALKPTLLGPAPAELLDFYHRHFGDLAQGKISREA
jgi:violacein biosynthesis protein VioB